MLQFAQPNPSTTLSKKAKRELRKEKSTLNTMSLKDIIPLTEHQDEAFSEWHNNQDLMLMGSAGTGKTYMALYFALREVVLGNADKVLIVRSAVPSREMGFLPGSETEKMKNYEMPYADICADLFQRGDAYSILKQKGIIEFSSTSFLRGLTFKNCVVVVDEMQNLAWMELHTVMSRIGDGCRMIFSGDTRQSDLETHKGKADLLKIVDVVKRMLCFSFVTFQPEDCVRSGKARQYLMACESLGY